MKVQNITIQLCCQTDEYFHTKHFKCEPLPMTSNNIQWNLNLKYLNGTERKVNLLRDFTRKIYLPCEKPEALHLKWNETVDIKTIVRCWGEFCY